MFFSRKVGPFLSWAGAIGAAISIYLKPVIEANSSSIFVRALLHLSPLLLIFLFMVEINIRLIYWKGSSELQQRLNDQWTSRILGIISNDGSQYKFIDILDYIALAEIWLGKLTYSIGLWNWEGNKFETPKDS